MSDFLPESPSLRAALDTLPATAKVVDFGGWFRPLLRATHVADAMPYQTRLGSLNLHPLPGERFRSDTWMLADFTAPDFQLPVADKFFDFAYAGQTVEDLTDPEPLLREMSRVARGGVIESPSRLTEQTVGVRDRITPLCGHPHHRWILDSDGPRLELSPKSATATLPRSHYAVPLLTFERLLRTAPARDIHFAWRGSIDWRILSASAARARARSFRADVAPTLAERSGDPIIRRLRGLKWLILGRRRADPGTWFQDMLRLSETYLPKSARP